MCRFKSVCRDLNQVLVGRDPRSTKPQHKGACQGNQAAGQPQATKPKAKATVQCMSIMEHKQVQGHSFSE